MGTSEEEKGSYKNGKVISLQVRDFSASKGFYTKILGFNIDPAFNLTDFALFETNSIPFALTKSNLNLEEVAQPGLGITLWIDCDGVNELWAKLAAAGVTILKHPLMDRLDARSFLLIQMHTK